MIPEEYYIHLCQQMALLSLDIVADDYYERLDKIQNDALKFIVLNPSYDTPAIRSNFRLK